jgi:23S rRNA A2030 N6-methylase RlmJ
MTSTAIQQLRDCVKTLEQYAYWREEFRKIDEWKQGIRDLHGREPTTEEMSWYFDTQGPQD